MKQLEKFHSAANIFFCLDENTDFLVVAVLSLWKSAIDQQYMQKLLD